MREGMAHCSGKLPSREGDSFTVWQLPTGLSSSLTVGEASMPIGPSFRGGPTILLE